MKQNPEQSDIPITAFNNIFEIKLAHIFITIITFLDVNIQKIKFISNTNIVTLFGSKNNLFCASFFLKALLNLDQEQKLR